MVVIAVMNGFTGELRAKIVGSVSHVGVVGLYGPISNYEDAVAVIRSVQHVTAAAPVLTGQALLRGPGGTVGVQIRGVVPELESGITGIGSLVIDGAFDLAPVEQEPAPGKRPRRGTKREDPVRGIVIGRDLERRIACTVGSRVDVVTAVEEGRKRELKPRMEEYEVRGVFSSGLRDYDSLVAFISLGSAQELFGTGDVANAISVRTDEFMMATMVARQIEHKLGPGFRARSWAEDNAQLFAAIRLEKLVMFVILVLIVAVAASGIVSTLTMVVMAKTRQIGILKALGASRRQIQRVFMLGGVVVGALGTVFGVAAGVALCIILDRYLVIKLPDTVYLVDHLPVQMEVRDIVLVAGAAFALSFVATIYPAYRAVRLDPVEALHYE